MPQALVDGYTRFERARILGARALQLANGAPALIETDAINPIDIARTELEEGVIPIGIRRD
ncbi:MAG: DNA-directed RNA polymerase subunit K [Candidatus Nanohaloarchaea archaeon]